jgi:glutamine synthetase
MSGKASALSFVARHRLWSEEQNEAAVRLRRIRKSRAGYDPLLFPDQHGILRGKTLVAGKRCAFWRTAAPSPPRCWRRHLASHGVSGVHGGRRFGMTEMQGAADVLMIPDPTTFRVLPWAPTTGWVLCDVHFADGRPVLFATRGLYKSVE